MALAVALVQFGEERPSLRDRVGRMRELMRGIDDVDLIVLPELWPTGYFNFTHYAADAQSLEGPIVKMLCDEARRRNAWVHGGSFVEKGRDGLHNTAVLIDPAGELALVYRKIHVFGIGSREQQLLAPGTAMPTAETPFGIAATSTCYDLRFPELFRLAVDQGAETLFVPAAWPAARAEHWRVLLQTRAIENQCFVVACNGAGRSNDTMLAGHSAVIDPWGRLVAEGGESEEVLVASIDPGLVGEVRSDFPVLGDRRTDLFPSSIAAPTSVAAEPIPQ